jgi:hypothetical protein
MNERIKELAEQAGWTDGYYASDHGPFVDPEFNKEKFAELIVRECVALMNDEKEYFSKPAPYESRDYYERCRAKEDAFEDAARMIKNHFGVE